MIGAPSWVAPPALFADTWYNSAMLSSSLDVEVVTWERLQESTQSSATNKSLHSLKTSGAPEDKEMWPADLQIIIITMPWYQSGPCSSRMIAPFIPIKLREEMMEHLHASHVGATELLA